MPTELHRCSKFDTALLLDAAADDIFVDQSERRTNLADNTTYVSEAASARAAIDAPRNLTVVFDMASDDHGILLQLGSAGTYSYRISLADGDISVAEAGATRATLHVPGLAKVPITVLVHWSQRVEDGDVVSELAIYNYTANAWGVVSAKHGAETPDPAHTLTVAAGVGGASAFTKGIEGIAAVHIGRRFHSTTEASEDWVAASSPGAFDGQDRTPLLTGAAAELAIAAEGSLAGPSMLWAGVATRQATARTVGPFINARPALPAAEYVASYPVHFYRPTPDGAAGWQWCIRYLWHGYLSPKVNVAQVRAHVRCYDTFGGGVISPVRFRGFSIADLPVGAPGPALTYYRGPIVSVASPSDDGVWLNLGVIRLARAVSGLSYFALAFVVDQEEDEGDVFSTTWQLNALIVDPYSKNLDDGGFGDVDEKAGP